MKKVRDIKVGTKFRFGGFNGLQYCVLELDYSKEHLVFGIRSSNSNNKIYKKWDIHIPKGSLHQHLLHFINDTRYMPDKPIIKTPSPLKRLKI